jgi:YfiH family protein
MAQRPTPPSPETSETHPGSPGPEALQAPLLRAAGFAHAFFTRRGGVSEGPYASLHFAVATGDTPENVRANVERAGRVLGVEPGHVLYLSQVHGDVVVEVTEANDREATIYQEGDAMVARAGQRVACGVRSADCGTLLMADARSGAVCAIHAGWRGTVKGIVAAGVARLRELAGGAEIVAAIGPHIERCCFEVGEDVAAELAGCSALGEAAVSQRAGGKAHVDLRAILRAQLVAAGVDDARIDDVRGCTVCDPERFFSYRRQGPKSGRHLAAIVPRASV